MKKFLPILIFLSILNGSNLLAQCNISVDAGPDLKVCRPGDMVMINGKVTGSIQEIFWEPPTGLSNPKSPVTKATVSGPQEYILTARGLSTQNLIINGNFEAGRTGFTTDYMVGTTSCYGFGYLDCEGTYDVINNPQLGHTGFAPCMDHTSGSGMMMVINGSAAFQNVWCEDIVVMPDMDYVFTAWITSVVSASPPVLQFSINGSPIGPNFSSSGTVCQWEKYEVTWNSGSNTNAEICILNENTATGGNDFAIDDLGFRKICEVKDTMKIDVEEIIISIEDPEIVTCDKPSIRLNAKASSTGIGWTYQWTSADGKIISGGNTLEPVIKGPGTYFLTVCSPIPNCCKTESILVSGNITPPDLQIITKDTLGCNRLSVTVNTRSTVFPLDYKWGGPNGFNSLDPFIVVTEAGKYTITITDDYNCKTIDSVTIFERSDNPKIQIQSNSINCKTDTAYLIASSTVPGSLFEWIGPSKDTSTKSQWNVVDSGWYYLKVTSPTGCIKFDSVRILKDKQAQILKYSFDTLSCLNDSIDILVTGNRNVKSASWQNLGNYRWLDSLSIRTATAGRHSLQVESDNGCVSILNLDIPIDTLAPNIQLLPDTLNCSQTTIALFPKKSTSKLILNWGGPNNFKSQADTVWVDVPGNYFLNAIAENGCQDSANVFISIDTLRPLLTGMNDTLTCIKTQLNLLISDNGTSQYSWLGPSGFNSTLKNPLINLAGDYQVTARKSNGCQSSLLLHIYEDITKPILQLSDDTLTCSKDSIKLKASSSDPTAIFQWIGPNGFSSNQLNPYIKEPGSYILKSQSKNGCSDSAILTILQDIRKPDLQTTTDTLNCLKRIGNLTASSTRDSLNYSWTDEVGSFISSSKNISVTKGGIYSIKVSTPENCFTILQVFVPQDTISPQLIVFSDTLNCLKTQTSLRFSSKDPIQSFAWSGPGGFTSSLQNPIISSGGNYTLKLTGTNYCTALDSLNILIDTIKPRLQLQFDSINCMKREVDLVAMVMPIQLVGSWTLSNMQTVNSNSIKTKEGGTYSFSVTAPNYCTNSQTIFIAVDTISPDLQVQDDTLNCIKQLAQIQAMSQTNGLLYDWSGPGNFKSNSRQINTSIPGNYTINVTGKNFCTQTSNVFVSIDTIHPELKTQSDTIDCIHTEANLIASTNINPGIFSWKDSQGNLLTNQLVYKTKKPGAYLSEIVNPLNGCRTQKTQTVLADSLIITDVLIQPTNPTCGNKIGSAQIAKVIGGHSDLRYSIDFKKTYSGNPNLNQLVAGHYTLFVIDNQQCEFQKDFDIIELPYIETNLQPEITISLGDSIKLDLNILSDRGLIDSISWSPTDDLSCSNCEDPFANPWVSRFYTVTVIDTNGCESTQRIHILVEIPKVWVPNVFSPNGDNINDWLTIFGSKAEVTKINIFQIFDRWGNRVFESKDFQPNDLIHGWNGNYQGEKCNPGVYVYWGEVELINGLKWVVKGDVTLIR